MHKAKAPQSNRKIIANVLIAATVRIVVTIAVQKAIARSLERKIEAAASDGGELSRETLEMLAALGREVKAQENCTPWCTSAEHASSCPNALKQEAS